MREHYHTSIDNIVVTTVIAILGINLVRLGTSKMAQSSNPTIAGLGKSVGALVTFG